MKYYFLWKYYSKTLKMKLDWIWLVFLSILNLSPSLNMIVKVLRWIQIKLTKINEQRWIDEFNDRHYLRCINERWNIFVNINFIYCLKQVRSFRMLALSLIILYNKIKPRILTIQHTFLLWSRLKLVEKIRASEADIFVSLSIEHRTHRDWSRKSSLRSGERDSHSGTTFSDLFSSGNECRGCRDAWFSARSLKAAPHRAGGRWLSRLINKLHCFININRIFWSVGKCRVNVFDDSRAHSGEFRFPGSDLRDWSLKALIARGGSSMKEVKTDSTAHKNNLIEHMLPPISNTIYHIPMLLNRLTT